MQLNYSRVKTNHICLLSPFAAAVATIDTATVVIEDTTVAPLIEQLIEGAKEFCIFPTRFQLHGRWMNQILAAAVQIGRAHV